MSLFACTQAVPIATTVLKVLLQATLGTDRGPMGPCLGPYPSLAGLGKGGFLRDFQEIVHFDYFKTSLPGWCSKVLPMKSQFPWAKIHIKALKNHGPARQGEGSKQGANLPYWGNLEEPEKRKKCILEMNLVQSALG